MARVGERGWTAETTRGRCGAKPLSGRMMSGAPTGRVTALDYQRALPDGQRVAGRCAASEQPPHESDKNALSDHLLSRVRPRYVRPPGPDKGIRPGEKVDGRAAPEVEHGPRRRGGARCSPTSGRCRSRRRTAGCSSATPSPQLGQQMTNVAVALQVYDLTHSSFYVGLVGVFALVPLVALGLYGGAIADAVDRRTLALFASAGPVGGLDRARGAGLRGQRVGVAALRLHRGAVGLLRGQQPGPQRHGPAAARQAS